MDYRPYSLRDYNSPLYHPRRPAGRRTAHWLLAAILPLTGLMLLPLTSNDAKVLRGQEAALDLPELATTAAAMGDTGSADDQATPTAEIALPEETSIAMVEPAISAEPGAPKAAAELIEAKTAPMPSPAIGDGQWRTVTVQKGDSLAKIFDQQHIDAAQLQKVLKSSELAKKLTRIHPGQSIQMLTDASGTRLLGLKYELDRLNSLEVRASDDGFESELVVQVPDVRRTSVAAKIDNSLFVSASKAGLPDKITMELAEIFGWDIDFALDIREGDRFAVLYEEHYLNGEKIDAGRILAAEFENNGHTFKAVRFVDNEGNGDYYTPDGRSLRKAFIRTPVAFTRISSKFTLGRKHPILNTIRAHKGVDYAAPTGTPIKATGNGKIVFEGTKGGYGRCVVIQHGSKYSTLYGHMSRFQSGLSVGSRVRQGDIIGYVGMSGLATGPHLHYEFLVDGVHRNPLTVTLPNADPLPARYMAEFKQVSESNLALLGLAKSDAVALNR